MMEDEVHKTLKLPPRIYKSGTEPDKVGVIMQHSSFNLDKYTVKGLMQLLENNANRMSVEEKLFLGAAILTHGIIIAKNSTIKVPRESLKMFSNLDRYSVRHWGKMGYDVLFASIWRMKAKTFAKPLYEVQGFVWAITWWALSAVPVLGPLCLQWKTTRTLNISEVLDVHNQRDVIVNTVIGDPEEYNNLVPPTNPIDKDFATVVQLVMQGYRLSRSEWIEGKVDGVLASEQIRTKHNRRAELSRTTHEAPLVTDKKDPVDGDDNNDPKDPEDGEDNNDGKDPEDGQDNNAAKDPGDDVIDISDRDGNIEDHGEDKDDTNGNDGDRTGNVDALIDISDIDENHGGDENLKDDEGDESHDSNRHGFTLRPPLTDEDVIVQLEQGGAHPIFHPFQPYLLSRKARLDEWKNATNQRILKDFLGHEVNGDWFLNLQTPGTVMTRQHMDSAMHLLRTSRKNSTKIFANSRVAIYGEHFLLTLKQCWERWRLSQKWYNYNKKIVEGYINGTLPAIGNTEKKMIKDIDYVYAPKCWHDKQWVAVIFDLKKGSVSIWDSDRYPKKLSDYETSTFPYAQIMPMLLKRFVKGARYSKEFTIKKQPGIPKDTDSQLNDAAADELPLESPSESNKSKRKLKGDDHRSSMRNKKAR
ncbi:unnamed protein product, partial [Thlaspi arvense]